MATSQTIAPSLGHAPSFIDLGPGAAGEGYSAIDDRRVLGAALREGILSDGAYAVTAGAGTREISIAANTGDGVVITGDSVAAQGKYLIAPHSAAITLQHDAADATNPRNDLVILEVLDSVSDAGGSNLARVRIVKGTPNASATREDALGVNGTPSLPSSAIPLAVVNVDVGEGVLSTSDIDDRRYRTAGKKVIDTEQTTTSASYTLLTTPDQIPNIVVPTDGLIVVYFRALPKTSSGTWSAAVHLNGTTAKMADGLAPIDCGDTNTAYDKVATTNGTDLTTASWSADVTTGQAVGVPIVFFAAAGVYTVDVRWKTTAGTLSVKNRKLSVRVLDFPA